MFLTSHHEKHAPFEINADPELFNANSGFGATLSLHYQALQ